MSAKKKVGILGASGYTGADAVRLQYRYGDGDPWLDRTMTEETGNEFSASVSATEVRSGFWYKVTAGDAQTPGMWEPTITAVIAGNTMVPTVTRPNRTKPESIRRRSWGSIFSRRPAIAAHMQAGSTRFKAASRMKSSASPSAGTNAFPPCSLSA